MMEFFTSKYHVARKEHTCEACGDKILIGAKYRYECGKYEGDFFDRCYHTSCWEVMQDYFAGVEDTEFTYEDIQDWWQEERCYQCTLCELNGGECDCDMDKRIWCTKFKKGAENK